MDRFEFAVLMTNIWAVGANVATESASKIACLVVSIGWCLLAIWVGVSDSHKNR